LPIFRNTDNARETYSFKAQPKRRVAESAMATARQRMLVKLLEEKYKHVGYVAGRYVEAGCSVEIGHRTRFGVADVVVKCKGGVRLVVKVFAGIPSAEDIETVVKIAELLKAKPVVVLCGFSKAEAKKALSSIPNVDLSKVRVKAYDRCSAS